MHRLVRLSALLAFAAFFLAGGWLIAQARAQEATPATETMVLIEHSGQDVITDWGNDGLSAGDVDIWGPNPLYDEANTTDTGATTQGTCTLLNPEFQCVLVETIQFPDGSTLQLQGVELNEETSLRVIVGGSGRYLGAIGVVTVEPTDDRKEWIKRFEIILPGEQ